MSRFSLQNIRTRLTLWNILVFGSILALYTLVTSWFFLSTLNHQLEGSLKEDIELVEQMLIHSQEGSFTLDAHDDDVGKLERFLEIWTDDRRLLYRSKTLRGYTLGSAPEVSKDDAAVRIQSVELDEGVRLRVGTKYSTAGDSPKVIRLGISEAAYFSEIRSFLIMLFVGIPLTLVLVSISAYAMARRALKPIDLMSGTAQQIGVQDLRERIPVQNPYDELGRLAFAFNELLARVQHAFEQLKQFTSDASHELRTPLTAMRSVGEVGLQVKRTPEEYREVIGSMLEESNRLTRLVDSLLFLSRAESGKQMLRREEFDLVQLAQEAVSVMAALAEEKQQHIEIGAGDIVTVRADRGLISQALYNLLDNAIKFSPHGGTISVEVGHKTSNAVFLSVSDHGPGIPESEREKIFERFHRSETSSRQTSGAGLGLAITRWAVDVNDGSIEVSSREGPGAIFQITLPLTSS
jgi:heavy metal sensor kinase